MIKVIFDKNINLQTFNNQVYPVYTIQTSGKDFQAYLAEAKKFVSNYAQNHFVVISPTTDYLAINLFSTALFTVSILEENFIDGIVFKVADKDAAMEAYRPFIALCIALKYVLYLYSKGIETIYREIANVGYLGLDVHVEYAQQQIVIHHSGTKKLNDIIVDSTYDALVTAAYLKTISLLEKDFDVSAYIKIRTKDALNFDIYDVVCETVKKFV